MHRLSILTNRSDTTLLASCGTSIKFALQIPVDWICQHGEIYHRGKRVTTAGCTFPKIINTTRWWQVIPPPHILMCLCDTMSKDVTPISTTGFFTPTMDQGLQKPT